MAMIEAITRSFQSRAGANNNPFDHRLFNKKVVEPLRGILKFDIINRIIILVNGEVGNQLAEYHIDENTTPTTKAIKEEFTKEIEEERIVINICKRWGQNPGSAIALNKGIEIAEEKSPDWIFSWSLEMEIDGYRIYEAINFAEEISLHVVGFLRERWWEKTQWNVVQNTAALWRPDKLKSIGGFHHQCDGTGETIYIEPFGDVPVAGMEDFHAMLRLLKQERDFRWGMVGRARPLRWATNFEHGSEREQRHLMKVARQYRVMEKYSERIFPETPFLQVLDDLFSRYHQK